MNKIILTKQSNENEIKNYFKAVLKLAKSKEEFPVNLDEVRPLVYARKDKAIDALKQNFIEGIDYNLNQSGKVLNYSYIVSGITYDAKLSVSCLEYFIARKNRSVFEVYRQARC